MFEMLNLKDELNMLIGDVDNVENDEEKKNNDENKKK